MGLQISTGLRNHILDTGDIQGKLDGASIRLYSGSQPASSDDAKPGASTLLAIITPLACTGAASSGSISIDAAVSVNAVATGTAGWFRLHESGDATPDNASTTAARIDGTVGTSGANLNFPGGTSIQSGAPVKLDTFTINAPAA